MYFKYISGRKGSELRKIWKPVPEIGIDEIDYFYHVQAHLIILSTKQQRLKQLINKK